MLLAEWRAQVEVGGACLGSAANLTWRARALYRGAGAPAAAPACIEAVFADAGAALAGAHARGVERALASARGVHGSLGRIAEDVAAVASAGAAEYAAAMRGGGPGAAAALVSSSASSPVPVASLAEWLDDARRWVEGEAARKGALLEALAPDEGSGGGGGGEGEEEEGGGAAPPRVGSRGLIAAAAAAWPDARGAACADGTPMCARVAELLRLVLGDASG